MRIVTLVLLGSLVLGTHASAQDKPAQKHRGLWGGFGLGSGINLTDTFNGGSLWGFTGYGRIGGTLNQRVMLGGESSAWFGSRDLVDFTRGNLSGLILFYPSPRGGLFLKGGVGLSYIMTAAYQSQTVGGVSFETKVSQSQGGFGLTAGVGRDVRLGRNLYLVPEIAYYLQVAGSETSEIFGTSPGSNSIISFTIGLVWH